MNDDILLGVQNLRVAFGCRPVIDEATLALCSGDKVIIRGESGCGKSTLLNALIGSLPPVHVRSGQFLDAGKIFNNYRRYRRESTVFGSISVVFQDAMHSLHPYRTVIKQISEVSGSQYWRWFQRVNLVPDQFNNKDQPVYPKHCSGGELQRLSIIFPMALSRPIVFLDEPLTDIDIVSRKAVIRTLGAIFENPSTTVVLVSHDDDWVPPNFRRFIIDRRVLMPLEKVGSPVEVVRNKSHVRSGAPRSPTVGTNVPVLKVIIRKQVPVSTTFRLWPMEEFTVRRGDRVGIVGESGSGKSTFLRLIAGLFDRANGASKVLLRNTDGQMNSICHFGIRDRARKIQLVLQDTTGTLFGDQRVGENFKDIRRQSRVSRSAFDTRLREWADRLRLTNAANDIDELMRRQFDQFSIGQRRRLSLLRALLLFDTSSEDADKTDRVLLLDEMSRGLDATNRERLSDMLDEILDQHNIALISVSHDLQFLRSTCNIFRVMLNGAMLPRLLSKSDVDRLVTNGRIDDLKNPYYGEFFSQIESTRYPQLRADPGCLLEITAKCSVRSAEGCRHHNELIKAGEVGICG
jgi:peptide/nickel transport system ATP-binding protein